MIRHFTKEESGQGLVEYALILLLIAIAVMTAVGVFGVQLEAYYQSIVAAL